MNSNGLEYNIAGQTTAGQTTPAQQPSVVVDAPLTKWYCDVCGGLIEGATSGAVTWQIDHNRECLYNVKIVHLCDSRLSHNYFSCALDKCVGPNGLAHLLAWMSPRSIDTATCGFEYYVADHHGFVDFIRRVQIPYYEQARRYFDRADVVEYYAGLNDVAPYYPDELKILILKFGSYPD